MRGQKNVVIKIQEHKTYINIKRPKERPAVMLNFFRSLSQRSRNQVPVNLRSTNFSQQLN